MAFSTQNNSKDNKFDVNTRGITFYNKDGFDPSALSLGFWNDSLISIKINPALPKEKQTSTRVYDYEKSISTAIPSTSAKLLSNAIKTKILPAIEANEDHSVGIQIGGDNLIVVGTGKRITNEIRPYFAIHKALNPASKKPEMSAYYEFNKSQIIENYNEENGDYTLSVNHHSELMTFLSFLDAAVDALSKADVHAMRVVMRAFNEKLMNNITAIGVKVGADIQTSQNNSSRNHVDFSSSNSDMDSEFSQYTSEMIGSLDDLN